MSELVYVEPSTEGVRLHIIPNLEWYQQFLNSHSDTTDHALLRQGQIQDVQQFVKTVDNIIVKPVECRELMVN